MSQQKICIARNFVCNVYGRTFAVMNPHTIVMHSIYVTTIPLDLARRENDPRRADGAEREVEGAMRVDGVENSDVREDRVPLSCTVLGCASEPVTAENHASWTCGTVKEQIVIRIIIMIMTIVVVYLIMADGCKSKSK